MQKLTLKSKKTVFGAIVFVLLAIIAFFLFSSLAISHDSTPALSAKTGRDGFAVLEINGESYQGNISAGESVYDFMNNLRAEGYITFTEDTYLGMGKFISAINGISGGDKNWIYYVNGKEAEVGISNYKINPGDVVSWKYESGY